MEQHLLAVLPIILLTFVCVHFHCQILFIFFACTYVLYRYKWELTILCREAAANKIIKICHKQLKYSGCQTESDGQCNGRQQLEFILSQSKSMSFFVSVFRVHNIIITILFRQGELYTVY